MRGLWSSGEWVCPACKERITWSLDRQYENQPREVRAFTVTVEDEIRKHEQTHQPAAVAQGTA
jgi:hypothetical protein